MKHTGLYVKEKKAAIQILVDLASSFSDRDAYLEHLEGVAVAAFELALCDLEDLRLGISDSNRAERAFGRSAVFLANQEREIQRRINAAVCGMETDAL